MYKASIVSLLLFKKAANKFEPMEISESIYEVVVELSH